MDRALERSLRQLSRLIRRYFVLRGELVCQQSNRRDRPSTHITAKFVDAQLVGVQVQPAARHRSAAMDDLSHEGVHGIGIASNTKMDSENSSWRSLSA